MRDFDDAIHGRPTHRSVASIWAPRMAGSAADLCAFAVALSIVALSLPGLQRNTNQQIANQKTDTDGPQAKPNGDLVMPPNPELAKPVHRPGTPPTRRTDEQPILSSLHWLAAHQMPDGRWSLQKYTEQCEDKSCTGPGTIESDAEATAMGVLPFMAAGQTYGKQKGLYRENLVRGIDWLIAHQAADGDLSNGSREQMYSHGLASIALSECYGTSKYKRVGNAARKAIEFIKAAQSKKSGGWGECAGGEGDMLTSCWQVQALKSAQLAGIGVKPATLKGAKKLLRSVAQRGMDGKENGQFSDKPGGTVTLAASAAGLLCTQMLCNGEYKDDPSVVAGVKHLTDNLPDPKDRNFCYWYIGSQAVHNMAGKDWGTWNRQMRKALVESQTRTECASGSWDPDKPPSDAWAKDGGRVATTSLSCLTLEIYYRYLPLFKLDRPVEKKTTDAEPDKKKSDADK